MRCTLSPTRSARYSPSIYNILFCHEADHPIDRHMIRHKEKDEEAGGEGLGHLATRKRLWRDANGNIVNERRPYRQEGVKRQHLSSTEESAETRDQLQDDSLKSRTTARPSLPTSIPSTEHRSIEQHGGHGLPSDTWGVELNPVQAAWNSDSSEFLCNADWGNQQNQNDMGSSCDLPYDDIFKPDTGTSMGNSLWCCLESLNSNKEYSNVF